MSEGLGDLIKDVANYFGGLITGQHKEMLNHFRVPTPFKIAYTLQADANGTIGGGFATPAPVLLWQNPLSHEAWIHRMVITSPGGPPKSPITAGQLIAFGQTNEVYFFLPLNGTVAPVIVTEGRASAPHVDPGGKIQIVADSLPANTILRFDLQLLLVTGISEYTPKQPGPPQRALIIE